MKKITSLRTGFLSMIVLCWLVPIVIVVTLASFLLGKSYMQSAQKELDANAEYAIQQVKMKFDQAVDDSKGVSYDGVIRSAYRRFLDSGNTADFYRSVTDYLNQTFSRNPQYRAVYVDFWLDTIDTDVYMLNRAYTGFELLKTCKQNDGRIRTIMENVDTEIKFLTLDGNLFVARNLVNSQFKPYATVVILLEPLNTFESLQQLNRIRDGQLSMDGVAFSVEHDGNLAQRDPDFCQQADVCYYSEVDSHVFSFAANLTKYNLFAENPSIVFSILVVALMVLPLVFVVINLFKRHVTRPMETLVEAHQMVQAGKRGYEIEQQSPNAEFDKLFTHFNAMSQELETQFERAYLEQQATQKAQIKALQSQINPHFLNNTLEIINWEARLAENDRVSAMIEALSTMLGAALDRKGRTQIPLEEELGYVDAYLYIIQERIGEGFHVHKEIDPGVLNMLVPRLILQPIAENAVEHDITARHGGDLWVRAYQEKSEMVVEVEHDGTMTPEDREKIKVILSENSQAARVGLHNVYQRIRLIYGDKGCLTLTETSHDTILARICFPADPDNSSERSLT